MTKLNLIESDGAEVEKTIKIFSDVFILILFLADKKINKPFLYKNRLFKNQVLTREQFILYKIIYY